MSQEKDLLQYQIELNKKEEKITYFTRSAMLWGSVACPRLARTLGRMEGGCGGAETGPVVAWT